MSGPPMDFKPNAQIRNEAAAWFVEFSEGEVPREMRQTFSLWLKASPEHVRAYLQVSATFDDLSHLGRGRTADIEALIEAAQAGANVIELEDRRAGESAARLSEDTPLVRESPSRARRWSSFIPLGKRIPSRRLAERRGVWPEARSENKQNEKDLPPPLGRGQGVGSRPLLAASVALVVFSLGTLALWLNAQRGVYATGIGEQRIVNLVDGSTIELNADSRLRVRFSDSERFVDLVQGQALFHVAKDPQHPFSVRTDGTTVRAVGTQFDVNRQASDTVVTVLEGRVAIARAAGPVGSSLPQGAAGSAAANETVALYASAGEQVILTAQAASKPAHPDVAAATAWRERKLVFSSSPLPVVVGEYNRYHEKRLVIADPALSDFHISGVFSAADATSLIAFLRTQSNINVEEQGSEIVLKSK
jgi:transmembrane sensor